MIKRFVALLGLVIAVLVGDLSAAMNSKIEVHICDLVSQRIFNDNKNLSEWKQFFHLIKALETNLQKIKESMSPELSVLVDFPRYGSEQVVTFYPDYFEEDELNNNNYITNDDSYHEGDSQYNDGDTSFEKAGTLNFYNFDEKREIVENADNFNVKVSYEAFIQKLLRSNFGTTNNYEEEFICEGDQQDDFWGFMVNEKIFILIADNKYYIMPSILRETFSSLFNDSSVVGQLVINLSKNQIQSLNVLLENSAVKFDKKLGILVSTAVRENFTMFSKSVKKQEKLFKKTLKKRLKEQDNNLLQLKQNANSLGIDVYALQSYVFANSVYN